jgi:hypothetical protein
MIKDCKSCGTEISVTTSQVRCLPCQSEFNSDIENSRKGTCERSLKLFKTNIKRVTGCTLGKYFSMLHRQGYKCITCDKMPGVGKKRLAVDHCHSSGKIRGLLCFECNVTLGKVRDNPTTLRRLASYLERSV